MRLFSTATIEMAKKKKISKPWANAGWQAVAQRIAAWQHNAAQIPVEAGGWIHNYVCPEHWQPLVYNGDLPEQHVCPAGHNCVGAKYDAAWRVWRHRQITDLAREAGLAYVVLGLEEGRDTAVTILNQYADFYTQFDALTDAEPWMLSGHAFSQALTEALWAVPLIHAYDLVADTLTDIQKERFARDLWGPLSAVVTSAQDKLIAKGHIQSNYMAWLNVTLGCLGFALNDQTLIERALQPVAGFVAHHEKAVWADGLEYEGTPYYHNFVLLADLILAEAALANNIDLYTIAAANGQSFLNMGNAFAQLAWPDGTLPDISDGSYWQDSIYDAEICQVFEILNAKQPQDSFAWILKATYDRQGAVRDNWAALLYGQDNVAKTVAPTLTNTCLETSGIAVLRSEKKLAALVSFGPYRQDHHQHDRLSLTVWPFSKDAGCPLYGLPARRTWYPHSYAHNTLVVDGQSPANCGGELLEWNGRTLTVSAPDAFPGIQFSRSTVMLDNVIYDELDVQSEAAHIYDWVFHLDGEVALPANLAPLSGQLVEDGPGNYIELHAQKSIQETITFEIAYDSDSYQLTLEGERPFTLLLGKAPGTSRHPQKQRLTLIGRTAGNYQRYRTTISQL